MNKIPKIEYVTLRLVRGRVVLINTVEKIQVLVCNWIGER